MPASDRRTERIVGWLFIGTFGVYLVAKGFTWSATRQGDDARHAPAPVGALA